MTAMTETQFKALEEIMGLNKTKKTTQAIRLHLVDGLRMPDAAKQADLEYQQAVQAISRAKKKVALCHQVVN